MMKAYSAFTLLEYCIYAAVSSLLCMVLCSWAVRIIHTTGSLQQQIMAEIELLCCIDCMARDIRVAPTARSRWTQHEKSPNDFSMNIRNKTVGYKYAHKKIYRSVTDDGKRAQSVLLSHVTSGEFKPEIYDKKVGGVFINVSTQKSAVSVHRSVFIPTKNDG